MNRQARLASKQQALDHYRADLDRLVATMRDGSLASLLLRDELTAVPDGYPPSTLGGAHGSEVSRPTEQQAIARQEPTHDPTHQVLVQLVFHLGRCADEARMVIALAQQARSPGDKATGRNPDRHDGSGDCLACTKPCSGAANDRLRAGYCAACYARWTRADRPDRAYFEHSTPPYDQPETA